METAEESKTVTLLTPELAKCLDASALEAGQSFLLDKGSSGNTSQTALSLLPFWNVCAQIVVDFSS